MFCFCLLILDVLYIFRIYLRFACAITAFGCYIEVLEYNCTVVLLSVCSLMYVVLPFSFICFLPNACIFLYLLACFFFYCLSLAGHGISISRLSISISRLAYPLLDCLSINALTRYRHLYVQWVAVFFFITINTYTCGPCK